MPEPVKPEVLISRLTSEHESWRVDAEQRLVELGAAAVGPLTRALQHATPAVRLHAVRALASLRDPGALPAVVAALGDQENQGAVAIAAERALVAWGEPAKAAVLDVALRGPEEVRPRALRALGRIGGADLREPLAPLLSSPAPAVRTQAAAALAAALGPPAIELIAPLLRDPDKWVRYGVAEALAGLGSPLARPVLEEARDDEEERGTHTQYRAEELLDALEDRDRAF